MWKWVRMLKSAALAAFLLPWLTVSCSNQQIASVSGVNLVTGRLTVLDPMRGSSQAVSGSPSLLILLAAAMIAAGLFFAFRSEDGEEGAAPMVMGTSAAALVMILGGTLGINGSSVARAASSSEQSGRFDATFANAVIRVDYAFGFWVTAVALAAAAGIAWQVWQAQVGQSRSPGLAGPVTKSGGRPSAPEDTAYWDALADKNDIDGLQEYLIRFPQGRFAALARLKLDRMNVTPLPPASDAAASERKAETRAAPARPTVSTRTCPRCGTRFAPPVEICTRDGSALV
jgi:hypothetical protein